MTFSQIGHTDWSLLVSDMSGAFTPSSHPVFFLGAGEARAARDKLLDATTIFFTVAVFFGGIIFTCAISLKVFNDVYNSLRNLTLRVIYRAM